MTSTQSLILVKKRTYYNSQTIHLTGKKPHSIINLEFKIEQIRRNDDLIYNRNKLDNYFLKRQIVLKIKGDDIDEKGKESLAYFSCLCCY